jgi:hypothetical protein
MFNGVDFTTRTMMFGTPPGKLDKEIVTTGTTSDPPSTSVTPPFGPLQIEKPRFDSILHAPKSTIQK